MPRNGSDVMSWPAGTTATPNTTIESSKYNAFLSDLLSDLNAARPVAVGGTGATSASGARTALAVPGLADNNTYTGTATVSADSVIIVWDETDAITDERRWRWLVNGGALSLQTQTDAGGGSTSWLTLNRTGNSVDSFAFGANLTPITSDGAALGTSSLMFSDAFLASGAVINFNAGDVTVTHAANTLTFGGAASGYAFTGGPVVPATNDAAALGTTSLGWSDLFLASGGVVNFNNGDVTVTHSANTLAFAGASSGYTYDAQITITNAIPAILLTESDGPSDEKNYRWLANSGNLNLQGLTDALGGAVNYLAFARTGTTLDTMTIGATSTLFADGAVSTPGISFSSDQDTGLRWVSSGLFRTVNNGADVVQFGTSGIAIGASFSYTPGSTAGGTWQDSGYLSVTRSANAALEVARITSDGAAVWFLRGTNNVGNISLTAAATAYNTSSDERIKVGFEDFDSGAMIDAITMYGFEFTAGGSGYGVKAQAEANTMVPNFIMPGSEQGPGEEGFAPWSADYSKLVPILWREVQDLRKRLAALEA